MGQSTVAREQLRAFVERIERLEEEKKALAEDIRDVYAEAKGNGYDVKVMREVVKLRKQEAHERQEHEAVLDLYKHALGMIPSAARIEGPHSAQATLAKPSENALLVEAHKLCVEHDRVSYSLLQNEMKIDATKAGKLIASLESHGVISKPDDQMRRKILITDLDFCHEKGLLDQ